MGNRSAPAKGTEPEWFTSATPWIAALAVLCASTALAGVIEGDLWLVRIGVVIVAITVTGAFLRATRLTPPLVAIAQVFVLLCLLTALHTRSGIFLFIPGPEALGDLGDVLADSVAQVQTGVPPVHATPAIQALVVLAIGLVAVLVDTLAVAAAAPAASGLVLLCVFAVPASLADEMLPFWTFVLGAAAFAMLLAVDGQHRHEAWRGRLGSGSASGSGGSATTVASIAMVIALIVGAGVTIVGTVGRLPGSGGGAGKGGIGMSEITSLRGMLNRGRTAEVFYVRGLKEPAYMRASTLDLYVPNKGWERGSPVGGDPANGELPLQAGDPGDGKITRIGIEPRDWRSFWLPTYGAVRRIDTPDDNYRFDSKKGVIYTEKEQEPKSYEIETVLSAPTKQDLRMARIPQNAVDPEYYKVNGVEQEVVDLAKKIVEGATNDFDKAAKLTEFFNGPTSDFKYELKTQGDVTRDALTDFVLRSKVGYCEQYASAMAVMARLVGLPSRVAIGFTAGFAPAEDPERRVISTDDAHAWVEIFFPNHGWMTFDPTPISGGRGVVPPYLRETGPAGEEQPTAETTTESVAPSASASAQASGSPDGEDTPGTLGDATPQDTSKNWVPWALLAALLLAVLVQVLRTSTRAGAWPDGPGDPNGGGSKRDGPNQSRLMASVRRWSGPASVVTWALVLLLAVAWLSYILMVVVLLLLVAATPRRSARCGAVTGCARSSGSVRGRRPRPGASSWRSRSTAARRCRPPRRSGRLPGGSRASTTSTTRARTGCES